MGRNNLHEASVLTGKPLYNDEDAVEALIKLVKQLDQKCMVQGCENHKLGGVFKGDMCLPCHHYLVTGEVGPTTSFLKGLQKGIKDEEGVNDG